MSMQKMQDVLINKGNSGRGKFKIGWYPMEKIAGQAHYFVQINAVNSENS